MKHVRLDTMVKGWFIGSFTPSLHTTSDFEVAVKIYNAGEFEDSHFHKIATEFTVVTAGEVEMNGVRYQAGDIVLVEPGETVDFQAITNATTTVVKIPSVPNDKFVIRNNA